MPTPNAPRFNAAAGALHTAIAQLAGFMAQRPISEASFQTPSNPEGQTSPRLRAAAELTQILLEIPQINGPAMGEREGIETLGNLFVDVGEILQRVGPNLP
ncbi:MAG: hypothetical protein V4510_10400 [bacterium]